MLEATSKAIPATWPDSVCTADSASDQAEWVSHEPNVEGLQGH